MDQEVRARELLAALAYKDGCHEKTRDDLLELDLGLSRVKASVAVDAMLKFAAPPALDEEAVERVRNILRDGRLSGLQSIEIARDICATLAEDDSVAHGGGRFGGEVYRDGVMDDTSEVKATAAALTAMSLPEGAMCRLCKGTGYRKVEGFGSVDWEESCDGCTPSSASLPVDSQTEQERKAGVANWASRAEARAALKALPVETKELVERLQGCASGLRHADAMSIKPTRATQVETTQITTAESGIIQNAIGDAAEALASYEAKLREAGKEITVRGARIIRLQAKLEVMRKALEANWPVDAQFALGDAVQKKGRASWRGKIVGWYRTDLTALGYAIESAFEPGSVQIYPETALLVWGDEALTSVGGGE